MSRLTPPTNLQHEKNHDSGRNWIALSAPFPFACAGPTRVTNFQHTYVAAFLSRTAARSFEIIGRLSVRPEFHARKQVIRCDLAVNVKCRVIATETQPVCCCFLRVRFQFPAPYSSAVEKRGATQSQQHYVGQGVRLDHGEITPLGLKASFLLRRIYHYCCKRLSNAAGRETPRLSNCVSISPQHKRKRRWYYTVVQSFILHSPSS